MSSAFTVKNLISNSDQTQNFGQTQNSGQVRTFSQAQNSGKVQNSGKKSESPKKKTIFTVLLLLSYVLFHLFLILSHEAVRDEAQAWTIAGQTTLRELFSLLPVEGHPALWFLFLRPFAKLGFPYGGLSYLSLLAVTAALAVFLFQCEMPPVSKLCVTVSSLFLYQNAVIARVYALAVLLSVLLADVWKERRERPLIFGLLIALLFQTHIIMAGFAGGLLLTMCVDLLRKEYRTKKQVTGILIGSAGALATFFELYQSKSDTSYYIDSSASTILNRISAEALVEGLHEIVSDLWPFERGAALIYSDASHIQDIRHILYILFWITVLLLIARGIYSAARSGKAPEFLRLLLVLLCGAGFMAAVYSWVYKVLYQTLTCLLAVLLFFFWNVFTLADRKAQKRVSAAALSVLFLLTAPTAFKAALTDLNGKCSGATEISRYMEETLPENSTVAVSNNCFAPAVCAELSSARKDIRFVNIDTGKDFTVYNWVEYPEKSAEEITDLALSMTDSENISVFYLAPYPFEFTGEFESCLYSQEEESSTWGEEFCLFRLR